MQGKVRHHGILGDSYKHGKMLTYRAGGCVMVFAKSRRLELGDNVLRTLYLQPL